MRLVEGAAEAVVVVGAVVLESCREIETRVVAI